MVEIRKATLKDLPSIQNLSKALIIKEKNEYDSTLLPSWSHSKDGKTRYTRRIREGGVFVAVDKEKTIGYLVGGIDKEAAWRAEKKKAELKNLFVLPAYRSKGIGAQLLHHFLAWAKQKKISTISVLVTHQNTRATEFYKKHGFKPFELTLEINPKNKHAK